MRKLQLLFLLFFVQVTFSQINLRKDKWNWQFGNSCALSFSTGVPIGSSSMINAFEGGASISSSTTGQLLFYTDGATVWTRNNTVMLNGTGLNGDNSSTQSAVIVPFPNDTNKYYIFTTDQGGYAGPNIGAYYSVVDMTLNGGLGAVTIKNTLLLSAPVTEKIVAVRSCNGTDSWVITHKFNSNAFYAFPITITGVGMPVISNIGSFHNNGSAFSYETVGCMAASNDGNKLAVSIYDFTNLLELFDFNRVTGVITNSISISTADLGMTKFQPYGLIFSPDNSKLYVTHTDENITLQKSSLIQLDVSLWSKAAILSSQYVVNVLNNSYFYFTLALGPDNKIYATRTGSSNKFLDVVNNPNAAGAACSFSFNAVNVNPGVLLTRGLPNFMSENINVSAVLSPTSVCAGFNATLTGVGANSYTWNGGAFTGNSLVISPTVSTTYTVTGTSGACVSTNTIAVNVFNTPSISLAYSPSVACASNPYTLTATGALNYTWTPGNISGNPIVVTPSTTTIYTVLATNEACTTSSTIQVLTNPVPTLSVAVSTPSLCSNSVSSVTLTASGATSYTWNPGNLNGNNIVVNPTSTTIYSVTGTNAFGCTGTETVSVLIIPTPTLNVLASHTAICTGGSATFTANGAANYTWTPGPYSNSVIVVSPTTTTTYTLLGANGLCSSTETVSLNVNPIPSITASASTTNICSASNSSVILTGGGGNTYTWNPGGLTGSTVVVSPTSTTNYTVTGENVFGCKSTNNVSIFVSPTPTLNTSSSALVFCSATTVTLTGSGASTYTWNPGGLIGSTVAVTPTISTTYTLSGTLGVCSDTKTISLTVNPRPIVTASSNTASVCEGNSAILTSAGNATIYTWMPGSLSGSSVIVTPTATTIYTVTGVNSFNCTNTNTVQLGVFPNPTVIPLSSSGNICSSSNTVILTASGANNYTWSPGSLIGSTVTANPVSSTVFTVTGMNINGCINTKTISVLVTQTPSLNLSATQNTMCAGTTVTLTSFGAPSYVWNPGITTGSVLVVSPSGSIVYTVTGLNGICSDTKTISLTVNPIPVISTTSSPSVICVGQTVSLAASGANTYTWTPGFLTGSVITVTPSVSTVYTVQGVSVEGCLGVTSVSITALPVPTVVAVTNQTIVCEGSSLPITLTANGANTYTWMPGSLSGSVISVPISSSQQFTVIGGVGDCYSSTTVSVTSVDCNKVFGITKAAGTPQYKNGIYDITFTLTAVNASSVNITNIALNENLSSAFPLPTTFSLVGTPTLTSINSGLAMNPSFNGTSDIQITTASSSTLFAFARDTIVFKMQVTANGVFCPFKNTVIGNGTYYNILSLADSSNNGFIWDEDGDGSALDDNIVTEICLEEYTLEIPTGFSPNSDGVNDLFVIKGLYNTKVNLSVFNRWGNKVYQKDEYDNTWDGIPNVSSFKFGEGKLPQGTYFYVAEFPDGEHKPVTGYVVIQY